MQFPLELSKYKFGEVDEIHIRVAMPAHFEQAANDRKDMLKEYYGSEDNAAEQCPAGLLRVSKIGNSITDVPLGGSYFFNRKLTAVMIETVKLQSYIPGRGTTQGLSSARGIRPSG